MTPTTSTDETTASVPPATPVPSATPRPTLCVRVRATPGVTRTFPPPPRANALPPLTPPPPPVRPLGNAVRARALPAESSFHTGQSRTVSLPVTPETFKKSNVATTTPTRTETPDGRPTADKAAEAASSRRFRFSQKAVDVLPPHAPDSPSREAEYSDTEVRGLRLLVAKNGRKTYYLRYVRAGKKRCDRIGEHGPLSLADARRAALDAKRELEFGEDPRATRKAKKEATGPTFREFAEKEYLPHARANKRSADSDESKFRVHLFPRFGDVALGDLTTAEIQRFHDEMRTKRSPATANRFLSLLHRMLALAVRWGRLDKNPADGVRKHRENNKRETFLSPEEIARFLSALEGDESPVTMGLFRFLLVSGLRLGEAQSARWDNVNLDAATLFLPETKAGTSRRVLLNEEAVATLRAMLPHRTAGNPFVFPGGRPGQPVSQPWGAFRRLSRRAALPTGFRIHDLRHTFASIAVSKGATLYEVQKLLGHHCSATTERYAHLADASLRRVSATVSGVVEGASRSNETNGKGEKSEGDQEGGKDQTATEATGVAKT